MATTVPIRVHSHTNKTGLRLIDPKRDMSAIVDLIALGFGKELDPQGKKILRQMRLLARLGSWGHALLGHTLDPMGFVWVEDGQVVGNLSLRLAMPYKTRGWLIGNVVVHPHYRRQGIGRALMDAALDTAGSKAARWIGLEVRADNLAACTLYEKLGFYPVGLTKHLVRDAGLPWPRSLPLVEGWRSSQPRDNLAWNKLASTIYQPNQRRILETRPSKYTFGGWDRKIDLWLSGLRESAWIAGEDTPQLAVRVKTDRRARFHLWDLLVHPEASEAEIDNAVAQAMRTVQRYHPWSTVTMVADSAPLVRALTAVGFRVHRTLRQMIKFF